MSTKRIIPLLLAAVLLSACSTTRALHDGEYRLSGNVIRADDPAFNVRELQSYLRQKPNSTVLNGWSPFLYLYALGGSEDTGFISSFLHKIGQPPVVYDPSMVDASIQSMLSHLEYTGYYGSTIRSIVSVHDRRVQVTYDIHLGKRYPILEIDYDLPESAEFREDFEADRERMMLRPGQYLSASALEEESERSAKYFRTRGYYGFSKAQYFFEADTLSNPGLARLKMSIREYARSETETNAVPLCKYRLGDVRISYDDRLKIRPSALENLNTLRPGQYYDETAVNRTYSRLSALNVFNGVNISMDRSDSARVDCNIDLRHSRLQGFKLNLEASSNSTGLIGISPQLNYFHKNIFHGGERLTVGLKGNFQFKPRDDVRSTEFTLSSGISFPRFVGLPNSLFNGRNVPKTDVTAAFNYQNRPEYTRTTISASYGYNGSIGDRFFFQFFPAQASVVRIFDMDDNFRDLTEVDPFMRTAYRSHFDAGVGAMLYYTTDNAISPKGSYHYYRLGLDLSGNFLSLFNRSMETGENGARLIWGIPYSQYLRTEAQIGRTFSLFKSRSTLAFRLLGGIGIPYGNSVTLPFEQAFYAGGANSLRGWQARTVGPGNAPLSDYFIIPNQTGDIKLEADLEFRFPLVWKLEGALFAEAGNVWSLYGAVQDESMFLGTLPESIAADWGLGLRLDFNIILVRLDFGMRVHDPARSAGDRWVKPAQWLQNDNFALHFGVGYPF